MSKIEACNTPDNLNSFVFFLFFKQGWIMTQHLHEEFACDYVCVYIYHHFKMLWIDSGNNGAATDLIYKKNTISTKAPNYLRKLFFPQ